MARFFSRRSELEMQRSQLSKEVEPRIGRIPFKGRYHKLPRTFEEDYTVSTSVLGKGYNGVVKLASAIHSSGKKRFAVKSFQTKGLADHKRWQLNSEIEIFLCMDHPHIARLVDVYETSETITIVMECAEGGELFDRVTSRRFSEDEAADATRQVLLALNYIHSHGIVHRDLKLENILYDTKGGNHMKLIDFGFSKFNDSSHRLHTSCGTLAYMAPEVLTRSYTSQCDLWSLGVITFILLSGHMPFHGSDESIQGSIMTGTYVMKPAHWKGISQTARDFTRALLTLDPYARLDAKSALDHAWIAKSFPQAPTMDSSTIDALLLWRTAPKFHRACMLMMAWMLTNEQQALVRDYFLALDTDHDGAISFKELRNVMVNQFQIAEHEVQQIFKLLDTTHHQEIHYSEFLAAMTASRIDMTDDLLLTTFHHFDTGNNGAISKEDFRLLLGDTFEGQSVGDLYTHFLADADIDSPDGTLSYDNFAKYARACVPQKPLLPVCSSPARRTFAPKLWAKINHSFHSHSPTAPQLPTLLRDCSPMNKSAMKPKKPIGAPPEDDEVPAERSCSKPILLAGDAASPANPRETSVPTQGSQGACCNVQ